MDKYIILAQPNEETLCSMDESRIPRLFIGRDTEVITINPENYTISGEFWEGAEFYAVVPSYYPMIDETSLSEGFVHARKASMARSPLGDIRVLSAEAARNFRSFDEILSAPCDNVFETDGHAFADTRTVRGKMKALELLKSKVAERLTNAGVMVLDKHSTLISPNAYIGEGTVIFPGCVIEGDTVIGNNCVIRSNCRLTDMKISDNVEIEQSVLVGSVVESGVKIGPFAYIRPGTRLMAGSKVGDFVEIKNSLIGKGTKVNHLSYIGDSDLGADINVGCGVVTCNYDGAVKTRSTVKDGVFIGCNVNLVSPVTIGERAYIAAGSTITDDIPDGTLAIARARQTVKHTWVRPVKPKE